MTRKKKIQLEYIIKCSPKVLFIRLCTPSGLAEWFADDVQIDGKQFTFYWKGSSEKAELTLFKENKLARFQWMNEDHSYFEFRITQDELTGDVSLIVTDFADDDELSGTITLWNNHIAELKHIVGS